MALVLPALLNVEYIYMCVYIYYRKILKMYRTYREKEIHKSTKNSKSPNPAKDSYSKYFQPTFSFFNS